MTTNMNYREILTKYSDKIIQNNQNIAVGNCSDIIPLRKNEVLPQTPYLINNVTENYLPFENSDLKDTYINKYLYSAARYNPVIKSIKK